MRFCAFGCRSSRDGLVCACSVNSIAGDACSRLVRSRGCRNVCTGGYEVIFCFIVGLHRSGDAIALSSLETAHLSATAWERSQMHATRVLSDREDVKSAMVSHSGSCNGGEASGDKLVSCTHVLVPVLSASLTQVAAVPHHQTNGEGYPSGEIQVNGPGSRFHCGMELQIVYGVRSTILYSPVTARLV